ncbi:MAG TPA: GNAT family N-acetyltransferase [Candidatus Limnocylindria bacterium]|nr:GNAT family N-acetyltransferase [Candidatus Limnocylindria bacterium]
MRFSFEPLAREHLPLLERWLLLPHVREWWDDTPGAPYPDLSGYEAALRGEDPTDNFLILADGRPVGFIESYVIQDDPEYARHVGVEERAAGVDLYIAEADMLHRGHGAPILRRFLRDVVFPRYGVGLCVIGPATANAAAIRAYEKAGFRHWKDVAIPGERWPERLMTLRREDLA